MCLDEKLCIRCEVLQPLSSFTSKAKPAIICKWCASCRAKTREYTRKVKGHVPWEEYVRPDGWCCGCLKILPLNSFYMAPSQKRGYTRMCKVCVAARNKIHNKLHTEKLKASKDGRKLLRRYQKNYYDNTMNDPDRKKKLQARRKLQSAVWNKKIIPQPCEICGETPTHGHHENYNEPLNVRWLCRLHHEEVHRNRPRH